MILIDKLCYSSKLRDVNTEEKFAFAMLTLIFCIVSRSIAVACIVLAVTGILTVRNGGIPLSRYLRLMRIPVVFLILGTLAILVNLSRTPLDAFAFPIGSWYLTGSRAGIWQGVRLIFTALSSVSCLYFLSLSTPMTDILSVLRRLRIPGIVLELMLLTYRYIFLLLELASSITTAQHSRLGNRDLRTSRSSFARMLSAVFVLSLKRSNALYDAMESRCYDGQIRVLSQRTPGKRKEILWIIIFELALLLVTIFTWRWRHV